MDVRLFFWLSVRLFGGYISFVDWLRMSMYFYKPRFNWINASRGQAALWGCKFAKTAIPQQVKFILQARAPRLVENGRAPLRYATIETLFFFSISIIFLFFFLFSFFSEGVGGGEGPGETEIFVCLFQLFFKFFKVRLRRVETTAVGENAAPNERRVLKEDSLRKHPFLLALRRWERFARRNVFLLAKRPRRRRTRRNGCFRRLKRGSKL